MLNNTTSILENFTTTAALKRPAPSPIDQAAALVKLAIQALNGQADVSKERTDLERVQANLRLASALPSFCSSGSNAKH